MSEKEKRLKMLGYLFAATVVISSVLILVNLSDYVGLLNSINKLKFSIDEMVHSPEADKIRIALNFSIENPTSYTRLKFSSLQCQLYLSRDGGEEYIGVAAYAPPVDISLNPFEGRSYVTSILVPRSTITQISEDFQETGLEWRVRCVIHFTTPIRKYYQNIILHQVSTYDASVS